MGATISISPTAEFEVSGRIMSRDLVVTGGTTAQRPTYAPPGTIRYNSTIGFMEAYTVSGWGALAPPPSIVSISPTSLLVADTATQVFTVSGASFDSGLAINLVGADGTNYEVVDRTFVNAATTTFKMGDLSSATAQLANRPYTVKITGGSGLAATSTQTIGLGGAWTSPAAGATLTFNTTASVSHTLAGTDAVGGTSGRTFAVAPGSNPLPGGLSLNASSGVISGTIGAVNSGTNVTFRVVDTPSQAFVERTFNIVGFSGLYEFSSHTFTNAGMSGREGPSLATLTGHADYSSAGWRTNTNFFVLGNDSNGTDRDGYQLWTVPADATYKIIATGASGAAYNNVNNGYGGKIEARFTLTKGTKLLLIVGQSATAPTTNSIGGGGGGASWVLHPSGSNEYSSGRSRAIYMIAGGGGGGMSAVHGAGTTRTAGTALVTSGSSSGGNQGNSYKSGGGAGFTSNGEPASAVNGGKFSKGYSPGHGAFGGESYTGQYYGGAHTMHGGFGGGGAANHHEGGGGGGYRGGNVPNYNTYNSDGGGKSWVQATGNSGSPGGTGWPAVATYVGTHTLTTTAGAHGSIYIEKM